MKIGVCLTVKNEAPYLAEWIVYHSSLGFHPIFIYDNNSQDRIHEAIRPYRDRVQLIPWAPVPAFPSHVADCLMRAQAEGVDWLALFDADEFVVPVDGDPEGVRKVVGRVDREGLDELDIPCYFYASECHILIPEGRVVDNYPTDVQQGPSKSIVRVASHPKPVSMHRFNSKRRRGVTGLRINHYHNKSQQDMLIRRAKGWVDAWGWEVLAQDGVIDQKWEKFETRAPGFPRLNQAAIHLSVLFKTPATQPELAVNLAELYVGGVPPWARSLTDVPPSAADWGPAP